MAKKTILAWHFLTDDCRLRGGDKKVRPGMVLTHSSREPLIPCDRGLHASVRLIDALQYAPGAMLCRVKCGGEIIHHGDPPDKLVCRRREVVWMLDATWYLHEFACLVAEKTLTTEKIEDERSWNAIEVKRRWLNGKASDEELAAAWDAARAAAWAAARDVARAAQNTLLENLINSAPWSKR